MQIACLVFIVAAWVGTVSSHGRLMDPPQRSSMWRLNFSTPVNYDDNALYCGGFAAQYNDLNQGRCGECGDEWSLPRPRDNDEGGLYGTGIIGKTYRAGETISVSVELTTSHKGHFEFRLCPKKTSPMELSTKECFDQYPLLLEDGSSFFNVSTFDSGFYYPRVVLPADVTCDYCVLQWTYKAGNSWGLCEDGSYEVGCGPQETFVNCADVAII